MTALIEWALDVFGRFGAAGLFVVAFAESSFFPVPPDVMLLPMCMARPRAAAWYAAITTASSVLGAAFGYLVGARGGRPLLLRFTDEQGLRTVQRLFDKYGGWAVGIAAFTPIPYKVFTIASGIFRVRLTPFFAASIIGRGGRFFLEAILAARYGEAFRETVGPRFETITLVVGLAAAALAIALGRSRRPAGTAAGTDAVADRKFARVRIPGPARFSRHRRNALAEWFIYLLAGFIFLLILLEELADLAASGAIPIIRSLDAQIALAIQSIRHPVLTWALVGVAFLSSYPAVFAGLGLAVFLFMSRPGAFRRIQTVALVSCVLGSAGLAILTRLTQTIPGPTAASGLPQLLTRSAGAGGLLVSACFYGMLSIILRRHAAAASLGPVLAAPVLMASSALAWVYLGLAWPSEAAAELVAAGMWLLICGWLMALIERKQFS